GYETACGFGVKLTNKWARILERALLQSTWASGFLSGVVDGWSGNPTGRSSEKLSSAVVAAAAAAAATATTPCAQTTQRLLQQRSIPCASASQQCATRVWRIAASLRPETSTRPPSAR
ncbi:unnamed protein product, partial [Ectocarpus sp. 12 AP-2014]